MRSTTLLMIVIIGGGRECQYLIYKICNGRRIFYSLTIMFIVIYICALKHFKLTDIHKHTICDFLLL